jgi:hypothetical protein
MSESMDHKHVGSGKSQESTSAGNGEVNVNLLVQILSSLTSAQDASSGTLLADLLSFLAGTPQLSTNYNAAAQTAATYSSLTQLNRPISTFDGNFNMSLNDSNTNSQRQQHTSNFSQNQALLMSQLLGPQLQTILTQNAMAHATSSLNNTKHHQSTTLSDEGTGAMIHQALINNAIQSLYQHALQAVPNNYSFHQGTSASMLQIPRGYDTNNVTNPMCLETTIRGNNASVSQSPLDQNVSHLNCSSVAGSCFQQKGESAPFAFAAKRNTSQVSVPNVTNAGNPKIQRSEVPITASNPGPTATSNTGQDMTTEPCENNANTRLQNLFNAALSHNQTHMALTLPLPPLDTTRANANTHYVAASTSASTNNPLSNYNNDNNNISSSNSTDTPIAASVATAAAIASAPQHDEQPSQSYQQVQLLRTSRPSAATSLRNSSLVEEWTFPTKVYHMLLDVEECGETDIISFTPSGNALAIHDADAFIRQVVHRYFNHTTIKSFKRQLYLYGFSRVVEDGMVECYRHVSFGRGKPELLKNISRKVYAKKAPVKSASTSTDKKHGNMK